MPRPAPSARARAVACGAALVAIPVGATAAPAEPVPPARWAIDAELRWAVGLERDAAAPTTDTAHLPALVLTGSRAFGALIVHARARMMVPLGYGQEALGAGLGLANRLGAGAVSGFGRVEVGVSYAFHGGAGDELGGDGVTYWGPYGRAEFGLRGPIGGGRADGAAARAGLEWTISAGASVVAARYQGDLVGRGNRLELDAGGGLRLTF